MERRTDRCKEVKYDMALLDLQGMESAEGGHGGGGGGSDVSLLLCDSAVSFTLCV
jgi:Lanthionine-containing peptide SapB precursor RamS